MTVIDLINWQTLDVDMRAIQKNNFTAYLEGAENTIMFFIIEEVIETILDFSQGTVIVLWLCSTIYFALI